MKDTCLPPVCWLAAALCWQADAQIYDTNNVGVQTLAGSGFVGYVDGQGALTMFSNPSLIVGDSLSNLFVWDSGNMRIREVTPDAKVSTFAGGGTETEGYGTNVSLNAQFTAMTIDHSDTIWMIQSSSGMTTYIYRISTRAEVTHTNLTGTSVCCGMSVDSVNNLYISDSGGNRILRYTTNATLEVFAGSGNAGSEDGNGIFSSFNYPTALATDSADNIFVWDADNGLIRRINQNRDVVTIAGHGSNSNADGMGRNAAFTGVYSMSVDDSGNVILACSGTLVGGFSIRKLSATTNVTTIAGSFTESGYTNGIGSLARFSGGGSCLSQGMILVADSGNQRIRQISYNPSPQPASAANLLLNTYAGLNISGMVGRTYRVQSSTNMSTWSPETTILLTSSPYLWFDQNPLGRRKYYRAFLLP